MFRRKRKAYKFYFCQIPDLHLVDNPRKANKQILETFFGNLGSQGYRLVGRWEDQFIFEREI